MSLVVESDEALLERARRETDAKLRRDHFNELFSRHQRRVALWCLRFTGDRETAADLAQEIFLKVYESADSFRGRARFSTWLYSVTRNHCLNHAQRRKRQMESLEEGNEDRATREWPDFLEGLEHKRRLELVRRLMTEKLTALERKVMKLRFLDELALDTITRLLDLENKSGAKAYIVSAKRKLQRELQRIEASHASGVFGSSKGHTS